VNATIIMLAGTNFHINAPGKTVVLRGLLMNGPGIRGAGVVVVAIGTVYIEHCEVQQFRTGIHFGANGKLSITDTVVRNNSSGGFSVFVPSGTAQVVIDRSQFLNNGDDGVSFRGNGTLEASITNSISAGNDAAGFFSSGTRNLVNISHSIAANNGASGFAVSGAGSEMSISHSVARGNGQAGMDTNNGSTIRVSDSVATNNQFGFRNDGSTFGSRSANNNSAAPGTNTVAGNTTNVSGTITYYNGN
jgi:Right handed beta helix region